MRIAICDDNEIFLKQMEKLLDDYRNIYSLEIYSFFSGEGFLKSCEKNEYDILFLDIEMNEISGIDVARFIKEKSHNTIIFFVTSHTSYVSDSFRLGVFQFLIKPINENIFKREFERAVVAYRTLHQKYVIQSRGATEVIEYNEIYYIDVYKKRIHVHTNKMVYECLGNLTKEYEKLKIYQFSRCHQGYIVNLNKVKRINKTCIILKNDIELPIGRHYKDSVYEDFNIYLAGRMI